MSTDHTELLRTFTEWSRQVAGRTDVPKGIRSAAAALHDDGKRSLSSPTVAPPDLSAMERWATDPTVSQSVRDFRAEQNIKLLQDWTGLPVIAPPGRPTIATWFERCKRAPTVAPADERDAVAWCDPDDLHSLQHDHHDPIPAYRKQRRPSWTPLYTRAALPAGWREVAQAVVDELDKEEHSPGHNHRYPGVWDDTGEPCAWCETWKRFKAMLAATKQGAER